MSRRLIQSAHVSHDIDVLIVIGANMLASLACSMVEAILGREGGGGGGVGRLIDTGRLLEGGVSYKLCTSRGRGRLLHRRCLFESGRLLDHLRYL